MRTVDGEESIPVMVTLWTTAVITRDLEPDSPDTQIGPWPSCRSTWSPTRIESSNRCSLTPRTCPPNPS